MFGKRQPQELPRPPAAADPQSVEILRVWDTPDGVQVTLNPRWDDPGGWGLLLVDIARHAANAYARQGEDPRRALARIRQLFDAEWNAPTDTPRDITGA